MDDPVEVTFLLCGKDATQLRKLEKESGFYCFVLFCFCFFVWLLCQGG